MIELENKNDIQFLEENESLIPVKIYELKNGMKLYLSINKDAPRIQTYIATRAGSKNDPVDATGLAHYLEHMLFKGSEKLGALDWKKESKLLKEISDLYEAHKKADESDRVAIYEKIDSLSTQASKLVVANEYDKLASSLGAKGTNAYTSFDRTVFINDIPNNELEKWFQLESERFSNLVLRLFHTELETVYEEFNIGQNSDARNAFNAFMKGLLPNHPYGTQTTIGTAEHLKTPSMEKIHEFFNRYYVPNNMAIVLSGDLDPEQTVLLAEKYFGSYRKGKKVKQKKYADQEIEQTQIMDVYGKEKSFLQLGWKLGGFGNEESLMAKLVSGLLFNGSAGLMDVDLIRNQSIGQGSSAGCFSANDYSFFYIYGEPRAAQGLVELKELLLKQVNRIQQGDFEDWLPEAVINNFEYEFFKQMESNQGRAAVLLDAFIGDVPWSEYVQNFDKMRSFTKEDIVAFAREKLANSKAVVVNKHEGHNHNINYVDKPKITALQLNRSASSEFAKQFNTLASTPIKPHFADYQNLIQKGSLKSGLDFEYTHNDRNKTFELVLIYEMGFEAENLLPLAFKYLKFLGTDEYSAAALQQEFFKLGVRFDVNSSNSVSFLTLSGLDRSFEAAIKLMKHLLSHAKADENVLKKMLADVYKSRMDERKDKKTILQKGMMNYAYYGHNSPLKSRFDANMLEVIRTVDLMKWIGKLSEFKHKIFYYGSMDKANVEQVLDAHHYITEPKDPIRNRNFIQLPTDKQKVVFVHYEGMVQAEILLLSRLTNQFDMAIHKISKLYNKYFGSGLASIVFQEIREARALAYSTYAVVGSPIYKDKGHYLTAFVGTQCDKVAQAINAMKEIIADMPMVDDQIENVRAALIKQMEAERVIGADVYWERRVAQKRGLEKNPATEIYNYLKKDLSAPAAAKSALSEFHKKYIEHTKFTYLILADRTKVDMDFLKSLGDFEEVQLDKLFSY